MKRILSILLVLVMVLTILPFSAVNAAETMKEITRLDDGTYIEVSTSSPSSHSSGTITKNKSYTYYAGGTARWKVTLTGVFTYDGTSSFCTASNCSVTIFDSAFYVVSKSATRSDNKAKATATIGRRVLGVTVDKELYRITLTCDKNGNIDPQRTPGSDNRRGNRVRLNRNGYYQNILAYSCK